MQNIRVHFEEAQEILIQFLDNPKNIENIEAAGKIMVEAIKNGNKIISCGNGGSMCDAMHFAEELSGKFRKDRKALPAISISDPTHISCVGNDYGYDYIFSRYIEAIGKPGDVILGISTSGNSKNVNLAAETAQKIGIKFIGLSGKDGGEMASLCDIEIRAPYSTFADRAQELHTKIIHSLIDYIERNVGC